MANMRIILCANSTSKLIAPIKSRCLLIRVAAPSDPEVSLIPCHLRLTIQRYYDGRWTLHSDMLQKKKSLTSQILPLWK